MIQSFLNDLRAKAAGYIMPSGYGFRNGAFERIWGSRENASGESITEESALKTVALMRSVSLVAGVAAAFPIDVIKRVGDRREKMQDHVVEERLDWNPNPEMSAYDLRFACWAHYLLWGNSYCLKVQTAGRLNALWPLHPGHVEVRRDDNSGALIYVYTGGKTPKLYFADEILHVRNFTLDGINGLSAIQQAALAIGLNQAAEKTAATTMRKGTRPTVVMEVPNALSPEQRTAIREAWARTNGGTENAGGLAIAEAGTKLTTLSIPTGDIQLIEQMGASDEKMAMIIGVPPSMIGITTKTTSWGSGIEMLKQGFLDFTLAPALKNHEQAYERSLLNSITEKALSIKHNTAAFMRMDLLKTMQAFQIAIKARVYNPNTARSYLDLNPYEGGDEYLAQMQDLPIEAALENKPGGGDGSTA
jgi:HK97 family phage portal protein